MPVRSRRVATSARPLEPAGIRRVGGIGVGQDHPVSTWRAAARPRADDHKCAALDRLPDVSTGRGLGGAQGTRDCGHSRMQLAGTCIAPLEQRPREVFDAGRPAGLVDQPDRAPTCQSAPCRVVEGRGKYRGNGIVDAMVHWATAFRDSMYFRRSATSNSRRAAIFTDGSSPRSLRLSARIQRVGDLRESSCSRLSALLPSSNRTTTAAESQVLNPPDRLGPLSNRPELTFALCPTPP